MSVAVINTTQHHSVSFLPAIFSALGRIDAEFLRLLFYHDHRESEEFFRLTGQLAQPHQDYVFSKRAAFFNGLKSKVGHIMANATVLRVNLNLAPSIPLLRVPLHTTLTPTSSAPLTSPTTPFPPMAHEWTSSTLIKVVAFASRSFTPPFTVFSGLRPT